MKRAILATLIGAVALTLVSPAISSWAIGGGVPDVQTPSGDVNGDGALSMSDAIYTLRFLFSGGPAPVEPQEPMASPELVEAIQTLASRLEARMPTEEEKASLSVFRASLTDHIWPDILKAREASGMTLFDANSLGSELVRDLELYTLSEFLAGIKRSYCLDRCYPALEACLDACSVDDDVLCEVNCTLAFNECVEACENE